MKLDYYVKKKQEPALTFADASRAARKCTEVHLRLWSTAILSPRKASSKPAFHKPFNFLRMRYLVATSEPNFSLLLSKRKNVYLSTWIWDLVTPVSPCPFFSEWKPTFHLAIIVKLFHQQTIDKCIRVKRNHISTRVVICLLLFQLSLSEAVYQPGHWDTITGDVVWNNSHKLFESRAQWWEVKRLWMCQRLKCVLYFPVLPQVTRIVTGSHVLYSVRWMREVACESVTGIPERSRPLPLIWWLKEWVCC